MKLKQAKAFKDMLLDATNAMLHPHIEGVFAVFENQYKPESKWVSISYGKPAYGVPVLLKINGTVQHITYCLDGGDDCPDWFEPYGDLIPDAEKEEALLFVVYDKEIEWAPLDEGE